MALPAPSIPGVSRGNEAISLWHSTSRDTIIHRVYPYQPVSAQLPSVDRRRLVTAFVWVLLPTLAWADVKVRFNRDVRPILADKCFHCHGPDEEAREAELRLDQEADVLAQRGDYAVIVPGKPEQSELIQRISAEDADIRMPPLESGRSLSDHEREILRRWITQGAEWQSHWSYVSPRRPAIPARASRSTPHHAWPQNAIDHFVLARLLEAGFSPSPPADRATLLRRVTLDLTGLPPTPREVDRFLADASPLAYERAVDRLLASPRYGEQMALMWLDAARYADTDGYQNDGPRSMWRWRDWIIEAYNRGISFDQFTIEQLAGDLIPNATLDQRIATGFNRNHRYNSEAGLVLEEFLLENAVDRVDTTATVWMGQTMGCARCHDHKYDPFSQREYYQLVSFFDNIGESGRAVKFGNSEPWVVAPTRHQKTILAEHDRHVFEAQAALEKAASRIRTALATWQPDEAESHASDPIVARGLQQHFSFDDAKQLPEGFDATSQLAPGVIGKSLSVHGDKAVHLGRAGQILCQKRHTVAFWVRPASGEDGVILSRQAENSQRPGLAVELHQRRLQFYIITRWLAGVAAVETEQSLTPGEWVHVALTNDGSQSARGMKIFLNGRPAATRILFNTNSNTGGAPRSAILRIGRGVQGSTFEGSVDELRFYNRTLWPDEIALLATPISLSHVLSKATEARTPTQAAWLRAWFLEHAAPADLRRLAQQLADARAARRAFYDTLPTTMVMESPARTEPTHIRMRGEYHRLGDPVVSDVPAALPPFPLDAPSDRLGLALWLTKDDHPLTARVTVNRYWQKYFGQGLVKTAEDFGVQGDPPSHPDLLDWLATEFVRRQWNIKQMQKLIVTSATYRQSSRVMPELLERDPHNILLARGPRSRLSAHALRDQALAASGLLVERIGGPSVSPYQPANLWEEMSNMTYRQSHGANLYRRSLYTVWKRTVAPPTMAILDAADREVCVVNRRRTAPSVDALKRNSVRRSGPWVGPTHHARRGKPACAVGIPDCHGATSHVGGTLSLASGAKRFPNPLPARCEGGRGTPCSRRIGRARRP